MQQAKANSLPRFNLVEWLTYALFAGIAFVITLLAVCSGNAIAWASRRTVMLVRNNLATKTKATEATAVTPAANASPKISSAKAPVVDWDEKEIEAAEIRRLEFEKGYVVFRFNKESGVVKGKLTVTKKALHRTLGKTVLINLDRCASVTEAMNIVHGKAEVLLASVSARKTDRTKSVKTLVASGSSVVDVSSASEMPTMLDIPFADMPLEVPPYLDDLESASMPPGGIEQFEEPAQPVVPKKASAVDRKKSASSRDGNPTYRGTYIASGLEERSLADPKKGNRTIKHFCVRIYDEDLDSEQLHWGNDLERAVAEANIQAGDRIELGVQGMTTVMVKNKPERKKVWALRKL